MSEPGGAHIARRRMASYWLLGAGLTLSYAAVANSGWHGDAKLHTIMEVTPTILAMIVGTMALGRYSSLKNSALLFVGTGFIGTALLDGYHMVVTSAFMAPHLPSGLSSLIPWSWVASRLFLSAMMCLSWFAWLRENRYGDASWLNERRVWTVAGVLTLASFLFFAFIPLSRAYYPEFIFHRPEEFVPAALFALALAGYLYKGQWRRDAFEHFLVLSLIVGAFSEAAIMSLSAGLFDTEFEAAHMLKSVSYVLVLVGLFKGMSSIYRQAEEREAHLRGIVTTASDGIIALDEYGIVTSFNPAASRIFGYQEDEVIGRNVSLLMVGVDHENHDSYVRNYLEGGEKKIIGIGREVEGRRKDGSMFPLDLSIGEMVVPGGRAFTGIIRDITEHKAAEEAVRKKTAQLALIKSIAVSANEINDLDAFIQSCLDDICAFTGWPLGHVYRIKSDTERVLHSAGIWHLEDPARLGNLKEMTEKASFEPGVGLPGKVLSSGNPEWIVDVRLGPDLPRTQQAVDNGIRAYIAIPINLRDECVMVMEFCSYAAEEEDRETLSVLMSTADQISRRIEREHTAQALRAAREQSRLAETLAVSASRRAEAASLAKTEFLDNMSHELRTPLNGMLGFAEMIENETLGPLGHEQYADYVKTIGNSGRHLLSIINDVLDYSKIESGKLELDPVAINLLQAVEDVVELLAPNAHDKGIELACYVAPDVPMTVVADPSRMRQILFNLTGNAIKFTGTGGVNIAVSLESKRGKDIRLRIEVCDTGIGIEEAAQEKLFQKFSQADASTTRKYGGSGLGLAISKHLVTLMDGEIGVNSQLGEGSVFWLTVALTAQEGADKEALPLIADCMKDRRVLVVDDNEVNRLVSAQYLEMLGAKVTTVCDGLEALTALSEAIGGEVFELAIIDYMMPDVDGVELGQLIRAEGKYDRLKMVLSSSAGQSLSNKAISEMGFDGALLKPLHRTGVLNCLAGLYGLSLPGTREQGSGKASAGPLGGRSLHFLIAEDNRVNQLLLQAMLDGAGHQIDVVGNGQVAVEAAENQSYDIVLMDVHMPVMNGLEATRQIRRLPGPAGQVPILAVTAAVMSTDRDKCYLAGMNDFVSKPIDKRELFQKIEFWTGTGASPHAEKAEGASSGGDTEVSEDAALVLDDFLDSIDEVAGEPEDVSKAKRA